jgi:hypothetical protein
LDWRSEVLECINSDSYNFPIHYNGDINKLWHVELNREQCLKLIDDSFIDSFLMVPFVKTRNLYPNSH